MAIFRASKRGVDEADIGPFGLGLQQVALAAGDPHHVAEGGEDHAGCLGHRDGVVHPAHGDHAHRAPRAVDQLDRGRQHVLYPVPVDGVGVAPAHLHELEMLVPGQVGDPCHQCAGRRRVPVLVDEAHGLLRRLTEAG